MIRNKLGLTAALEPEHNKCDPFYIEIEKYLTKKYNVVDKIDDDYKNSYSNDLFFDYYEIDRKAMGAVGMEEKDALEHRFDVWRIKNK